MPSKTVTRADLTEAVYQEVGLSRNESAQLVESVLEQISSTLASGESVKISSFGTFSVREKAQRIGRNPKTGEEVPIPPPSRRGVPAEPCPQGPSRSIALDWGLSEARDGRGEFSGRRSPATSIMSPSITRAGPVTSARASVGRSVSRRARRSMAGTTSWATGSTSRLDWRA